MIIEKPNLFLYVLKEFCQSVFILKNQQRLKVELIGF